MNSAQAISKLLGIFTKEQQDHIKPLITTVANAANKEGIIRGRKEAATMIEMLVLGSGDYTAEDMRNVMHSLRGE